MRAKTIGAALAATLLAFASAAAAQAPAAARPAAAAKPYVAKRTSFGRPSLEGMWNANFLFNMEADSRMPMLTVPETLAKTIGKAIADGTAKGFDSQLDPEVPELMKTVDGLPIVRGERRTRLVIEPADGKLPYTPEARKELRAGTREVFDNPEDRPTAERCLVELGTPPLIKLSYGNQLQIVQTRDAIALHTEYGDEVRTVPFTDTHAPPTARARLGDSIARWEGDTLVIETIGLPDSDRYRFFPSLLVTGDSKVIERFTRIGEREMLYRFTVIDPKTYSAPWLAEFSWYATDKPMFEHACHEGNHSLPGVLAGARHEEARKAETKVAAR